MVFSYFRRETYHLEFFLITTKNSQTQTALNDKKDTRLEIKRLGKTQGWLIQS